LINAGVVLLLLANVALFLSGKSDLHDPAVLVGSLVAGLVTQVVIVAIVYGLYRLVQRHDPRLSLAMVAFRTLGLLTALRIATMILPEGRNAKVRVTPPPAAPVVR
jgi:uncharacterized protein YacL